VDDPEQLNRDTEAARVAFEKFLLAPYEKDIAIRCDDKAGDGCKDPAEWAGGCNNCHGSVLLCGPHYNTHAVASAKFGIQSRCSLCVIAGEVSDGFIVHPFHTPASLAPIRTSAVGDFR